MTRSSHNRREKVMYLASAKYVGGRLNSPDSAAEHKTTTERSGAMSPNEERYIERLPALRILSMYSDSF